MYSASSAVTYTSVYTDSELGRVFWRADEELSDGGSPRVIVYGYDGVPMMLVAPPSPEEDPEEYEEDETEDGPVDYPMDGGDDRDDDDGDSSGYDADDEDEDQEDEEEEEHLALADSAAHSIGLSQTVHHELQTLREQVYAQEYQLQTHQTQLQLQITLIQTQQQLHETHSPIQQTEMAGLQETDHVRQSQIVETLRVIRDMRREMDDMQAELLALHGQSRRTGQPGGDARAPNHQDAPRDADSHI
nr:hypothetical protein [Tanacetum cinerariifolium]